jgi:solute carrier family 50 (sugar transporter)
MFVQCFAWTIYGTVIHNDYVFACNFIGVVLGLDMTMVCTRIGTIDQQELLSRLMVASLTFISLVIYLTIPDGAALHPNARLIWAFICVTLNLFMFTSPLSTMKMVIKTEDASSISFPTCVAQVGCSFFWASYGIIVQDVAIYAPNLIGVVSALAQGGLLAW